MSSIGLSPIGLAQASVISYWDIVNAVATVAWEYPYFTWDEAGAVEATANQTLEAAVQNILLGHCLKVLYQWSPRQAPLTDMARALTSKSVIAGLSGEHGLRISALEDLFVLCFHYFLSLKP